MTCTSSQSPWPPPTPTPRPLPPHFQVTGRCILGTTTPTPPSRPRAPTFESYLMLRLKIKAAARTQCTMSCTRTRSRRWRLRTQPRSTRRELFPGKTFAREAARLGLGGGGETRQQRSCAAGTGKVECNGRGVLDLARVVFARGPLPTRKCHHHHHHQTRFGERTLKLILEYIMRMRRTYLDKRRSR